MQHKGASIAYLRLPPRSAVDHAQAIDHLALPFAVAARGKLLQTGVTSLSAPSPALVAAHTVVLLLAASDVTLLRVEVPPLPAHRLPLAMPALVEDRLIGDVTECVMAAGRDQGGWRTVAVVQREWLLAWVSSLHDLGVHRLRALPVQLCVPLQLDDLTAALMVTGDAAELVVRFGTDEGIGLALNNSDDVTLPDQVLALLATLAGQRAVDFSLPADFIGELESALASNRHTVRLGALRELHWTNLIDAASDAGPDLMLGVDKSGASSIRWQHWRWPLWLAMLLVLVNIVALQINLWRLRSEVDDLTAAMSYTYRRAFPNETVVVDPLVQMQRKIAALHRQAGEPVPEDFLSLAAAFGDVWPVMQTQAGIGAQSIAALTYRDQTLEVRFKPDIKPSVEGVQSAFAARGLQVRTAQAASNEGTAGATVWQIRSEP